MKLLNQKEAMFALSIKAKKTFLELEEKGLPFIQAQGKGTKKQYYFPDMLTWMKTETNKHAKKDK